MSWQLRKRQKTVDQGKATATASVPILNCLPPELLETICGFLDARTLCTARLVCALFHAAASRCLHSVEISVKDLRSRPETHLTSFPNLSRVSIRDVTKHDLLMLTQSRVGNAVTHLHAVEHVRQVPRCGCSAAGLARLPLPNLVSLTISRTRSRAFSFPQSLRELILERRVTEQVANLVVELTSLTCLRIDVKAMREPFEAVTALTGLQRLQIRSSFSLAPAVAKLTQLTHLQFRDDGISAEPANLSLASFSRLHRLVHLGIGPLEPSLELELAASMERFTSLRSLDVGLCAWPEQSAFETVCMTPLSQLTALRLVGLGLDASVMPRFKLEGLQDLSLSRGVRLDRNAASALRRATGLTRLQLWTAAVGASEEVGKALSCMPRLRALSFGTFAPACRTAICSKAIARLTGLTSLEWGGKAVNRDDALEVCLGLKKLRVLKFLTWNFTRAPAEAVTPETFFAVTMLHELSTFKVNRNFLVLGWELEDFVECVRARLNMDRHDKGWPALELSVDNHATFTFAV